MKHQRIDIYTASQERFRSTLARWRGNDVVYLSSAELDRISTTLERGINAREAEEEAEDRRKALMRVEQASDTLFARMGRLDRDRLKQNFTATDILNIAEAIERVNTTLTGLG